VTLNGNQAVRSAHALRAVRETTWPDRELTQAQLAKALSSEGRVAGATLSSWESGTDPKTPSGTRISGYARFFCTKRSLKGEPHLIAEDKHSRTRTVCDGIHSRTRTVCDGIHSPGVFGAVCSFTDARVREETRSTLRSDSGVANSLSCSEFR